MLALCTLGLRIGLQAPRGFGYRIAGVLDTSRILLEPQSRCFELCLDPLLALTEGCLCAVAACVGL